MTAPTVPVIQDRIHAINQTISAPSGAYALISKRYFPQNLNSSDLFPCIFSLPEFRAQDNSTSGAGVNRNVRQYRMFLAVDSWGGGIPTETGQMQAELWLDPIANVYLAARLLQLSNVPLDGVIDCIFTQDTGIIPFDPLQLATVQFVLSVTTIQSFTMS